MNITFHGAAREVTGSCFLVEGGDARFLVDCGLFQGGRDAYLKNIRALGFDLRSLDFVILTHAHLDHSGLLPRLVSLGFRGPIYATHATLDLLGVMLLDSAHIQEKEAEWENRRHHGRHARRGYECAPLYTVAQAQASLLQLRGVDYDTEFRPQSGVRCCMRDAGHILGSAIAEIWCTESGRERKLVFSGDLGQPSRPVVRDPTSVDLADVLVMESTYGNRLHKTLGDTYDELTGALQSALAHGNAIIPAFAVGRTQELLFVLADLARGGRLKNLDIYVDSPMALAATRLTLRNEALLDAETRDLIAWQQHSPEAPRVRFVQNVEESIALNRVRKGAVIISASGMCDAGRIKYHLLHNLSRRECAVLITGFQAAGTLGRRLVDGARNVTLFGERVTVRAPINTIGGLSAHADQRALLEWLGHFRAEPTQTFIVHGESDAQCTFRKVIQERLGWSRVTLPEPGSRHAIA